jgi:hypothetical protein
MLNSSPATPTERGRYSVLALQGKILAAIPGAARAQVDGCSSASVSVLLCKIEPGAKRPLKDNAADQVYLNSHRTSLVAG